MSEQVLVIPTAVFHEAGLFQGFSPRVEHYLSRLLAPRHLSYRPRDAVETDPSFKQIIPYVVLRHGEQVYHYTRGKKGTETRLRALRSIGVGGHINPGDGDTGDNTGGDPYRAGMLREIAEEIHLECGHREHCLGLINDDATPVGQVHLGIVHIFDLDGPHVRRREEALVEDGFSSLAELRARADEFETWSRFVMEHLARPGA
jgi:predicted NUDIX family phosphoesterase